MFANVQKLTSFGVPAAQQAIEKPIIDMNESVLMDNSSLQAQNAMVCPMCQYLLSAPFLSLLLKIPAKSYRILAIIRLSRLHPSIFRCTASPRTSLRQHTQYNNASNNRR
jgi:hypothetical protein